MISARGKKKNLIILLELSEGAVNWHLGNVVSLDLQRRFDKISQKRGYTRKEKKAYDI